jgi:hypothetical protein
MRYARDVDTRRRMAVCARHSGPLFCLHMRAYGGVVDARVRVRGHPSPMRGSPAPALISKAPVHLWSNAGSLYGNSHLDNQGTAT